MAHLTGKIIHQRYCVVDILGEGGTGITYRALDQHTNQQVAIKTLSLRQVKDWKVVELFEREAKVLQQLQHPHIPKYLDYFVSDNDRSDLASTQLEQNFYIVQELAEGQSLFRWLQEDGRCTEAEVKAIAVQVLKILGYLHGLNPPVIHRDIKPHNLIRREDGHIFLVDFGAVQNTYHSTFMRGSTVVGTFGYMAPEQFRGQAAPATDFYGLGATLLFLLTQRSPAELPTQKLKVEFRSRIQLSDSFADWLEKMLEPAAKDRFESAQEALTAINHQSSHYLAASNSFKIAGIIGLLGILLYLCFPAIEGQKYLILNKLGLTASAYQSFREGNLDIDEYLQKGGDINARDTSGQTLIYEAIASHNISSIKDLLAKGATLDVVNNIGRTLLHTSVLQPLSDIQTGDFAQTEEDMQTLETIDYLLNQNKIDLLARDSQKKTAIDYISSPEIVLIFTSYLKKANLSSGLKNQLFKELISKSKERNWKTLTWQINKIAANVKFSAQDIALQAYADQDRSAFRKAIRNIHKLNTNFFKRAHFSLLEKLIDVDKIQELLPNVNTMDQRNSTLLNHLTTVINSEEKVIKIKKLIQMGADLDQSDISLNNPLMNCLDTNDFRGNRALRDEVAFALINADAKQIPVNGLTPLHAAVWHSNRQVIELLLKKGANPNAKDKDGNTPLHTAVLSKKRGNVEQLLRAGSNVNSLNNSGQIPLHYASHPTDVIALIKADSHIDVKDYNGATPLHTIVDTGENDAALSPMTGEGNNITMADSVSFLIRSGAQINAKDKQGSTPLHYLVKSHSKNKQIAHILVEAGVDINAKDNFGFTPLHYLDEEYQSNRYNKNVFHQIEGLYRIFSSSHINTLKTRNFERR
jgi:serine/threonine protein kinase